MPTFAEKPKTTRGGTAAASMISRAATNGASRTAAGPAMNAISPPGPTAAAQRVQRQLRGDAGSSIQGPGTIGAALSNHDFGKIAVSSTRENQQVRRQAIEQSERIRQQAIEKTDASSADNNYQASFVFQTFIPDKYVPGTGGLGYGDNRGFGKPGDSYRTFQQITVQTDEAVSRSGVVGAPVAKTGVSETKVPFTTGHASAGPLHLSAERQDARSVLIRFDASIQNGSRLAGMVSPAIDFKGAIAISSLKSKPYYYFSVSHDAFPAYEAFINGNSIYRWSYPAGSTIADLVGSGTAIQGERRTGDAPGGVINAGKFEGFGGGRSGGGGAGGSW